MKIASLIDAVEISSRRKRKKRWHKIVSVLVAIVVFLHNLRFNFACNYLRRRCNLRANRAYA